MKLNAFNNVVFLSIYFNNLLSQLLFSYNQTFCISSFNDDDKDNNSKLKMKLHTYINVLKICCNC